VHAAVGCVEQDLRFGGVACLGRNAGEGVEGKDLDGGVVVEPSFVEDGGELLLRAVFSFLYDMRRFMYFF
jgi:hypothetical protein